MELSEQEKEAIENIDLLVHCLNYGEQKMTIASERQKEIAQELQKLLNLVEKQQKETEREKQYTDFYKDLCNKQQKEIKDWFEIADNILRATNDYGNITIGDIPKYIEKLQKEIEELKKPKYIIDCKTNKITKLTNDFISKDKIREKIKCIEDIYKKEMKPYQTEYGLNISFLSKKEKEELINKRNGLLTQKITLEELLEGNL